MLNRLLQVEGQNESRRILTGEVGSKFVGVFGQKGTGVDRLPVLFSQRKFSQASFLSDIFIFNVSVVAI